jgi:hypothetical protein
MNCINFCAPSRNFISPLDFSNPIVEIPVHQVPVTAAGMHVHRRYHVAPGIADLLGLLAGLGASEEVRG